MRLELLVDSAGFWPRLAEDLACARSQVLVQTYTFEGDGAGQRLSDALRRSAAADRRLVVDAFTWHRMSDQFLYHPRHLLRRAIWDERRATRALVGQLQRENVGVRFTNPVGWLFSRLPFRSHKKLIVVDRRVAYLGGINFSDHNFAWHDLMVRIDNAEAAAFLADDFEWTWRGVHQATAQRFDGLELHVLSAGRNAWQFGLLLDRIERARGPIFVESPYLAPPFSEALARASRRGARVVVVTPSGNNWPQCRDHILWKAATSALELRFYPDRMTHMKAMLIDDCEAVLGSANFELWSYRFQQEYLCFVTDADLVRQFQEKIVAPDLALSHAPRETIAPSRGRWADWRFKWLERLSLLLS